MKACVIDGQNLKGQLRAFGVLEADYLELGDIIKNEIGSITEMELPIITVSDDGRLNKFLAYLEGLGYQTISSPTYNQQDDEIVKNCIRSMDASRIKEIVCITCDAEILEVLNEKAKYGFRCFALCGLNVRQDGSFMLTRSYREKFPDVEFVDLAKFIEDITSQRRSDDRHRPVSAPLALRVVERSPKPEIRMTMSFALGDPSQIAEIYALAAELSHRFRITKTEIVS